MPIELSSVRSLGTGLRRPECVLCLKSGDLFVAHLGHGVMHIAPSGEQQPIGNIAEVEGKMWIPNGIALLPDRSFLIANMGEGGGLWRLGFDGSLSAYLREIDGVRLTATNFVVTDDLGRIWVTVTTRRWPISEAFSPFGGPYLEDGYLVLIDKKGARIVADGLAFANEARLDAAGRHIYVAETYARRISRFAIGADGALSGRTVFTSFGRGTFPDGMAFDAEGHLWVVSLTSNRLIRVAPDGVQALMLEENDAAHTELIEQKLDARNVRREDLQRTPTKTLKNIASITFGGEDLRTGYLGSLGGESLAVFHSPVAGLAPPHWNYAV